MKIYTKTGDDGSTRLGSGQVLKKSSQRIEAYGQIDELTSWIGAALAFMSKEEHVEVLREIQNDLHKMMAELSQSEKKFEGIGEKDISVIEALIDDYVEQMPPLTAFILPGGSKTAALIHLCRTSCRKAEREVVKLGQEEFVNPVLIKYLNRLSDLLFVLARKLNHEAGVVESNPEY
ncbi:MAG: cob(I)yrinic acid a,c-diamide adenosyltransferase [Candidatus Diapherotrites archaeon]|uniref:Cob(I)yrinic acid a,c-diamide adenosyltransferase n=1 Tax=Candidatus Iainarchaeum sp. TaxID=3101447 RepID=A0A8T4LB52_9ARCH|nr:cob(I)yrinic acid a,c-diamide adenosyltransferase [Candidatus Diapherotrites archaeon]